MTKDRACTGALAALMGLACGSVGPSSGSVPGGALAGSSSGSGTASSAGSATGGTSAGLGSSASGAASGSSGPSGTQSSGTGSGGTTAGSSGGTSAGTSGGALACAPAPATIVGGAIVYPQVLATDQSGPVQLLVDQTSVYWFNMSSKPGVGSIMKVAKNGGCPQTLASGLPDPNSIALSGHWLYWADDVAGTIERVSTDGMTEQTVISKQTAPGAVYVFGDTLYWFNGGAATNLDSQTGTLMALDLDGGAPRTLVSELADPSWLAVDATGVYFTLFGAYPAPDPCCPGGVFLASLDGGAAKPLAIENLSATLCLTADSIYWACDLGICEVSKQGGPLTPVVLHEAETLATDATRLYWDWQGDTSAQFQDAWVAEQALDGGPLGYVANPVTFPTGIAVDDSYVYWAEWLVWGYPANGRIMKAPK